MPQFFINRPIVAMVIAIITVIVGLVMMASLPVAQYPNIVPPQIQVSATYVGADALTVEQSVATPIEQQVNGVDNMEYMYSINANNGQMTLNVFFGVQTDATTDQILTQMRQGQAASQLPSAVSNYGVTVSKSTSAPLVLFALYSPDGQFDATFLANYAYIDTRVTKDLLFAEGSRAPNSALHQGSLWTTYFFQEGVVKGFGAGIGMYAQGKRNGIFQCQDPANCQAPFELAGYVRMDAALYYRKQEVFNKTNLLAAINFTNLLDHRYFSGAQNFREIVYTGAPFTAVGSLRFEFY